MSVLRCLSPRVTVVALAVCVMSPGLLGAGAEAGLERLTGSALTPADTATGAQRTPPTLATWIGRAGGGEEHPFERPALHWPRVSLRQLVTFAYGTTPARVLGGPDWLDDPIWEVASDTGASRPQHRELRGLLQRMLIDRFALRATRAPQRVSALVLAVGAPSPRLRPASAKVDCAPFLSGVRAPTEAPRDAEGYRLCGPSSVRKEYHFRSAPLDALARDLEIMTNQVVVAVPAQGLFDIDLQLPSGFSEQSHDADLDVLMSALERQLGLVTQIRTEPTEMLSVESAARPALGLR
jgi:uncharacterized protein (TIGR03435 family)